MRALAVLSVMAYHLVWAAPEVAAPPFAQGGWVGVDVFFVLSGFLIGGLLLGELDRRGGLALGRFVGRRLLRLYPAMAVFLGLLAWFTIAVDHQPWSRIRGSIGAGLVYWVNVPLGNGKYVLTTMAHLWTLSVEFHFYLLLPPVLLALHAVRAPRWSWAAALGVLAVAVAAHRARSWHAGASFLGPYVSTFTRLDALLVGVILALVRHQGWLRPRRWVDGALALAGTGWLVFVLCTTPSDSAWLYRWGMVVDALAAAAVIWFLVDRPGAPAGRVLGSAVPRWLGRRSYAIYLYHYVVFVSVQRHLPDLGPWPRAILAPILAVAIAEASFWLVERPALLLKDRLRTP